MPPILSRVAATDARAWHRGYLLYALCVIGVLMFAIDGSIVAVALPTMMSDLHTTLPLITWTLAGYTLAQVALQPAIAKFSDNFGRNACSWSACSCSPSPRCCARSRRTSGLMLAGMGMGTAAPASNNAGIALLPRQAAAIAGLRAMIRSLGGVLGQGLIVVIMQFAPDRTRGLEIAFVGFGVLLLMSLPLVLAIPDAARERRLQRAEGEPQTAVLTAATSRQSPP